MSNAHKKPFGAVTFKIKLSAVKHHYPYLTATIESWFFFSLDEKAYIYKLFWNFSFVDQFPFETLHSVNSVFMTDEVIPWVKILCMLKLAKIQKFSRPFVFIFFVPKYLVCFDSYLACQILEKETSRELLIWTIL